jgi:hypothetical protein
MWIGRQQQFLWNALRTGGHGHDHAHVLAQRKAMLEAPGFTIRVTIHDFLLHFVLEAIFFAFFVMGVA